MSTLRLNILSIDQDFNNGIEEIEKKKDAFNEYLDSLLAAKKGKKKRVKKGNLLVQKANNEFITSTSNSSTAISINESNFADVSSTSSLSTSIRPKRMASTIATKKMAKLQDYIRTTKLRRPSSSDMIDDFLMPTLPVPKKVAKVAETNSSASKTHKKSLERAPSVKAVIANFEQLANVSSRGTPVKNSKVADICSKISSVENNGGLLHVGEEEPTILAPSEDINQITNSTLREPSLSINNSKRNQLSACSSGKRKSTEIDTESQKSARLVSESGERPVAKQGLRRSPRCLSSQSPMAPFSSNVSPIPLLNSQSEVRGSVDIFDVTLTLNSLIPKLADIENNENILNGKVGVLEEDATPKVDMKAVKRTKRKKNVKDGSFSSVDATLSIVNDTFSARNSNNDEEVTKKKKKPVKRTKRTKGAKKNIFSTQSIAESFEEDVINDTLVSVEVGLTPANVSGEPLTGQPQSSTPCLESSINSTLTDVNPVSMERTSFVPQASNSKRTKTIVESKTDAQDEEVDNSPVSMAPPIVVAKASKRTKAVLESNTDAQEAPVDGSMERTYVVPKAPKRTKAFVESNTDAQEALVNVIMEPLERTFVVPKASKRTKAVVEPVNDAQQTDEDSGSTDETFIIPKTYKRTKFVKSYTDEDQLEQPRSTRTRTLNAPSVLVDIAPEPEHFSGRVTRTRTKAIAEEKKNISAKLARKSISKARRSSLLQEKLRKLKHKTPLSSVTNQLGSSQKRRVLVVNSAAKEKENGLKSKFLTHPVKTVTKPSDMELVEEREGRLKEKQLKEDKAAQKKLEEINKKRDVLKQKNEEKIKRAQRLKEKLEVEKHEHILQAEKEKESKRKMLLQEREMQQKADILKKKNATERKLAENEIRRRQEEEIRLAKIREQKAEQQRLLEEKQRQQEQEEKRARERIEEKKRLIDAERMIQKKLALQKRKEAAIAMSAASKIGDQYKARHSDDLGLEEEHSEKSDDEDSCPSPQLKPPKWVEPVKKGVHYQKYISMKQMSLFMPLLTKTPNVQSIFNMSPARTFRRTSSAIWNTPGFSP